MDIKLRPYQKECVNIIDNMESGNGLVQMATGLGKTVVFSSIKRRGRVLILSHRDELVHQPAKYYDCPVGFEAGKLFSKGEEVVSASVQSLRNRLDRFSPDDFDMIITDEAHHAVASSYLKIYDYFRPRIHIGFTATPNRGDKLRLDKVYDKIIFQKDLLWGIKNKFLCNINCKRVTVSYDISQVKNQMGDFHLGQLEDAVDVEQANKEIADIYKKHAKGATLIFATSVKHAEHIAQEIEGAVVVSAKTENRSEIIEAFTKREIPCIVNCMIFTEGTDIPLVETIIIVRPTQNQSLYTQMVGRGLRQFPGKKELTLIDCVGITENLDLCTAPSLLGLDITNVPPERMENIEGRLTDLRMVIEGQCDNPVSWMLNVKTVDLFAKKNDYDMKNINWIMMPNGDLICPLKNHERLIVKAKDNLGFTHIELKTCGWDNNGVWQTTIDKTRELDMQTAFDTSRAILDTHYQKDVQLWDLKKMAAWGRGKATDKQKALIKKKLPEKELAYINFDAITKFEASLILNRLFI